jgi:enoyl-CoA hydratase/carnithine racemase
MELVHNCLLTPQNNLSDLGIQLPSWLLRLCAVKLSLPRAAELLLSGKRINAEAANAWGCVNVVGVGDGLDETASLARSVARDPSKRVLHANVKYVLFKDLLVEENCEIKAKL